MRVFLLCGVLTMGSLPVLAGSLTGDSLEWDYYAYGSLYQTGNTWTDPGSGGTFLGDFSISSTANTITFDYLTSGTWSPSVLSLAPTIYNGIAINLVSGSPFTSVSIDAATTMAGFNSSDISFTGSQIQVNWQNLSYVPGTIVELDVNGSGVPEPGTAVSVSLALVALVWLRRRQSPHAGHGQSIR